MEKRVKNRAECLAVNVPGNQKVYDWKKK